jgi:hypothetical protein
MIRFIVGLLVVFGCVGGMDTAGDEDLLILVGMTIAGLVLMYAGTRNMQER